MYLKPHLISILLLFVSVSTSAKTYFEMITMSERMYGSKEIPIEVSVPDDRTGPFPLIVYQHGSSRDGFEFQGGQGNTDEHGSRLKKAALARGFAVAFLDSFYEKGLAATDKRKFPKSETYAKQLRSYVLSNVKNIDTKNTFYTGFSYGGDAVLNQLYTPYDPPWTAVVASEPSCNAVARPSPTPYPVLIIKGTDSHYYPIACELITQRYKESGNRVELKIIEGANHYFSLNGQLVNGGIAFNGCAKNPILIGRNMGETYFYDGKPATREDIDKCFTSVAGKGQGREKLDEAIDMTLDFFEKHLQR
ncbi:MAG: hypothetical protein RLZZ397_357 [Pseudomonadota bacterium]